MHTPEITHTKFNEVVLKGYSSPVLNNHPSKEIYHTFVGEALPEDKLFVVLGSDSGLMLDYLASIATAGQRFIIIDLPEVIEHIKQTRKELLENQSLVKFELHSLETFEYDYLYKHYQDYVIRNAIHLFRSLVTSDNKGEYKGVYERHQELFHRFLIDRVDNHDFKKVFDQQLESVCDLVYPVSTIKDRLEGNIPGIVLGGGPSLDQVIPWLKVNQHKVWIFAASRICKRLQKEGITPDFIGVFDGQPLIFEYSKEMYAFQDSSILITGEHPYAPLIRQWSGLKVYSRRRFPWARGSEENFISDGPTVTNALFGIAAYLGVSNFYLAGVDFCFTLDGVCHESGSIEAKNQQTDRVDTKAINYRGEEVGTNIQLYDARNLFEEQFLRLKKVLPRLQAHNLNDGAAVMQGIDYQPIENIVLGDDKFSVVQEFHDQLYFDAKTEKKFQTFLTAEVNDHSKWFSKIAKESKKGIHLTKMLFTDESKLDTRIKEVLKLKERLEKTVGPDYQTLVNYGYQTFMNSLKPVESETDMSRQEMVNALTGFFGGLNQAAEEFLAKLNEIKTEIKFRNLELNPKSDFSLLAEHWLLKKMPGRFQVWLEHYSGQTVEYYKRNYPELVERLEHAFEKMKVDESALEQSFDQRLSSVDEFVVRLQKAFENKDVTGVRDIMRQLSHVETAEYRIAKLFAAGLLLELKEDFNEALLHYLTIDPKREYFIIQKQLYPLAFSLNQNEKGNAALRVLSEHDNRYMPIYADACIVMGDFESATAAYQAYSLLKDDTPVLIGYLRLLVQKGDIEKANALLQEAAANEKLDQNQLEAFVDSLNQPSNVS